MAQEKHFRSYEGLAAAVKKDTAWGRPRDYLADMGEFLCLSGLGEENRVTSILENPNPDLPILFAVNHYVRLLWERGLAFSSLVGTTREAITTSALVTQEARNLSNRDTVWFVKGDFSRATASLGEKAAQKAAVQCYGQIAVSKDNKLEVAKKARTLLKKGSNLAIYPEATVGSKLVQMGLKQYRLGPFHPFFGTVLTILGNKGYQIIPVSIYSEERRFHIIFGSVIDPKGGPEEISEIVKNKIDEHLPA